MTILVGFLIASLCVLGGRGQQLGPGFVPPRLGERCKWKDNITDIVEEPQHKYAMLEECLYYYLAAKSDRSVERANSLVLLPPTMNIGDQVNVYIKQMNIRQIWMNEIWKELYVAGSFDTVWQDPRMTWDTSPWKLNALSLRSPANVWTPDLRSERYGTASQSQDVTFYKDIQATYNGQLTAKLEYRIGALCTISNFDAYPNDRQRCCFSLSSPLNWRTIKLNITKSDGVLDAEAQSTWDVKAAKLTLSTKPSGGDALKFCVTTTRKSSTLKLELTLPICVSAILVVVAPLFGALRVQLYVKLFALLLQFLCFQLLVERAPLQIRYGDGVPKIYTFYEFTLAMTMVSIFVTLLICAFGRMRRLDVLPPPHRLNRLATAANAFLYRRYEKAEDANQKGAVETSTADYAGDWQEVFEFGNNTLSLLLLLCYIVGVLVLCT